MRKNIFIICCFLITIFSSCKEPKVFAVLEGKIINSYGEPIDSVLCEVFINGKLKKTEKYGDTMSEYRNDKKVRDFINGYNFSDSLGRFGVAILEEIEPNSEIKIRFKKDGYDSISLILNKSVTLDTTIQMEISKSKINSKSKIDSLIAVINGNEDFAEGIAEGPIIRGDSTIGGWDEYNLFDRDTKELLRIRTSINSDTSNDYRFYYKEGELYYSEHLEGVYKNKKTDTLIFEVIYSIGDSIILNLNNTPNPDKLIQYGISKIEKYKK